MIELFKKMHEHDIELTISRANTSGTVIKASMRSGRHCMVRYMDCENFILMAVTDEDSVVPTALNIMLDDFLAELNRLMEFGDSNCLRPATDA